MSYKYKNAFILLLENRPISGNNFVEVATPSKGYNTIANGPSTQTWQRPPSQPSKDVIKKPVIFVIGKARIQFVCPSSTATLFATHTVGVPTFNRKLPDLVG